MADDISPLEAEIRRLIGIAGPMPIAQYMRLCLTDPQHGYYMDRDPFGSGGDFITAPEISQMFGEIVGLWLASVWQQLGSPEDIYQRPCSEFVARFIGGTNILRGRRIAHDMIDCGGLVLRCGAGELAYGVETAVSVRLHEITLTPCLEVASDGRVPNETSGRVIRRAYLGASRDYLIGLADGQQVRVTAPLDVDVPVGGATRLSFPPQYCRALSH